MELDINKFNSLPQQVAENKKNIESMLESVNYIIGLDIPALAETVATLNETVTNLQSNKQDKLIAGQNITIVGNTISATDIDTNIDVQMNGVSIVINKVANIKTLSTYNEITNKLVTQNDVIPKSTSHSVVYGTDSRGNQTTHPISYSYNESGIVNRDDDFEISVPLIPLSNNDATSKKYVDDAVAGAGGGLTEIVADDIYFSTFFNTYADGLYILSATAQNKEITIHLGVDDLDTETIPWGNPNQKMLMFVNNEYQINPYNANIKWKGITIINGGGANSVYDIRQRTTNANIHIFNAVNNMPATIQDMASSKFDTIFGELDLSTFKQNFYPQNSQNTKYILMTNIGGTFDVLDGVGNVVKTFEFGDCSSSIMSVNFYVNQYTNEEFCDFVIWTATKFDLFTYNYTTSQLVNVMTYYLNDLFRLVFTHNATFDFSYAPNVQTQYDGIISMNFLTGNGNTMTNLVDLCFNLNQLMYGSSTSKIACGGKIKITANQTTEIYDVISFTLSNYDENAGTFDVDIEYIDENAVIFNAQVLSFSTNTNDFIIGNIDDTMYITSV